MTAGVRLFEKKRWLSMRFDMVERAAGRPLALRLWRVGTTGRLPFTMCALRNISPLTGRAAMRP